MLGKENSVKHITCKHVDVIRAKLYLENRTLYRKGADNYLQNINKMQNIIQSCYSKN